MKNNMIVWNMQTYSSNVWKNHTNLLREEFVSVKFNVYTSVDDQLRVLDCIETIWTIKAK